MPASKHSKNPANQNNLLWTSRCSKFNWKWNARKSSPKLTTKKLQIAWFAGIRIQCFSERWFAPICSWFAPRKSLQLRSSRPSKNIETSCKSAQITANHKPKKSSKKQSWFVQICSPNGVFDYFLLFPVISCHFLLCHAGSCDFLVPLRHAIYCYFLLFL